TFPSTIRTRSLSASTAPWKVALAMTSLLRFARGEEVVEGLRQRRVREHGGVEGARRQPAHHRELEHGHQLSALDAERGAAQDAIPLLVHDRLEEPSGLAG